MQISHYEEYIRSKPEWELVNVYADDIVFEFKSGVAVSVEM